MTTNRFWALLGRYDLVVYIVGGLVLAGFLHFRNSASGQSETRSLKQESFANEPLRINQASSSGRAINLGEKFSAPDDWLKSLSFNLTNISEQPITQVELALEFPETAKTGQTMLYPVKFGAKTPVDRTVLISAGGDASLGITEKEFLSIKHFVEFRQPLSTINQVIVRIQQVRFADGSTWFAGNRFVPDSSSPTGMRRVD